MSENVVPRRRASMVALLTIALVCVLTGCRDEPSLARAAGFRQGDVERGKYLTGIFSCQECHTVRQEDGVTLDRNLLFAGGVPFRGPDGSLVHTANVTISSQYPEEILDAVIRGRLAYKFAMPTHVYNRMASEDMRDITAYLKTLQPVHRPLPDNYLPPNSALPAPHPAVAVSQHEPPLGTLQRGEYLSRMCSCQDCHSPQDSKGATLEGRLFQGGRPFQLDNGRYIATPDITQNSESGLGRWSDEEIVRAIRTGVARNGRQLDHFMPYSTAFYAMSPGDMHDLIAFLRSLPNRALSEP